MRGLYLLVVLVLCILVQGCMSKSNQKGSVLTKVLSHNDYEQKRPLFDALEARINCVEVDIALINNELYVTHHKDSIHKNATFQTLYLDPLQAIIKKNQGYVLEKETPFILYINLKTKEQTTHKIQQVLSKYKDIVTSFNGPQKQTKPIVVICGKLTDMGKGVRYIVAEGNLDIPSNISHNIVYMTNLKWSDYFEYDGKGTISRKEKKRLQQLVKTVHDQGRILRFWGNPDVNSENGEEFWKTILGEGVDMLSTDTPSEIASFFKENTNLYN